MPLIHLLMERILGQCKRKESPQELQKMMWKLNYGNHWLHLWSKIMSAQKVNHSNGPLYLESLSQILLCKMTLRSGAIWKRRWWMCFMITNNISQIVILLTQTTHPNQQTNLLKRIIFNQFTLRTWLVIYLTMECQWINLLIWKLRQTKIMSSPVCTCSNDSYWHFKYTVEEKRCYEFLCCIITVLYQFGSFSQRVGLVDIKGHSYFLMLYFLTKI